MSNRYKRDTRGSTYTGGGGGGGGIAAIMSALSGGTEGGPQVVSDQPTDEGELEAGTTDGTSIDGNKYNTRVVSQPYTLKHPIWDALSGGHNALRVAGLNSGLDLSALNQQNALDLQQKGSDLSAQREKDRLNQVDNISRRVASDNDFNTGANKNILDIEAFDKAHGITPAPLDMAATGRMERYKMGNSLDTLGAGVAKNIYDRAVAENPFINDEVTSKAGADIAGNNADKEGAINRGMTFTSGRQFIAPKAQTDFDVSQAQGGESISKSRLNTDTNTADLNFNQKNQADIDKQKQDQMKVTAANLERIQRMADTEKMQTIPVDADHHILYNTVTKEAVLVGSQMNPKDPMNPLVTTKHWSMDYNGEIMPNGMIKRADGTLINPNATGVPSGDGKGGKDDKGKLTARPKAKDKAKKKTYTGGGDNSSLSGADYLGSGINSGAKKFGEYMGNTMFGY